jgi:hypothetical protein
MIKNLLKACALMFGLAITPVLADSVLIIDAQYDQVTNNVKGRLEAAGHTVTVTTNVSTIPTVTSTYQQVWDLRYSAALTAGEQTAYQTYVTNGGFAYFVTENPGCCQARNNSVAALVTALGGGTTTIGANSAMTNNISSNVNTKYMTAGITVNYAAVSAIVNSQGIPLISDGAGAVSGMSWIGRAGNLGQGVTGTIVTVADTNWLDQSRFNVSGTTAQQQNVTALDDIIRGIVAGTVGGTISANGNGAAAQQQNQNQTPTLVSTAPGTPKVTSTTTNGTTTSTSVVAYGDPVVALSSRVLGTPEYTTVHNDVAKKSPKTIDVTRTTTVIKGVPRTEIYTATKAKTTTVTSTTPRTVTTTTIPVSVATYSNGSTVSTDGTPVVTTSTTDVVVTTPTTINVVETYELRYKDFSSTSSDQTASVSAVGLKDALAVKRFNPFLVDALSLKDGAWITPLAGYAKTGEGSFRTSSVGFGAQSTVDENTFGIAGTLGKSNAHGFLNTSNSADTYGATAYILNKQSDIWTKASVGFNVSEYNTTTSLPIFALANSSKVKANNYYADLTFYSGKEFFGFRPLAGVTVNKSVIASALETGSPLLSTLPDSKNTTSINPYVGIRYDIDKNFGVEGRVTQSKDFKTVGSIRATANTEILDGVFLNAAIGIDKSSNLTGVAGTVGLKINF